MIRYIKAFLALALLLSLMPICVAFADSYDIMPCADSEFNSATTLLKSTKQVSFRAVAYNVKSSISVTACWLEIQDSDGNWSTVCQLPPPSYVSENAFTYSYTVDYSDYIGSGTYRIWATYDADGHSITRCSNERTF